MSDSAAVARTVRVPPERLSRWLDGFATRHGTPEVVTSPGEVALLAPDGAMAWIESPWGPLPGGSDPLAELVAAVTVPRRVGVLLARRRAHAVGIFDGPTLVTGRADSHYVQGRTKAGGWSQQRYARRRQNQAERSAASAATDVEAVLLPEVDTLDALVQGGDRATLGLILQDRRFEPLRSEALARGFPVFDVPDPNKTLLAGFAATFLAVPIRLNDLA